MIGTKKIENKKINNLNKDNPDLNKRFNMSLKINPNNQNSNNNNSYNKNKNKIITKKENNGNKKRITESSMSRKTRSIHQNKIKIIIKIKKRETMMIMKMIDKKMEEIKIIHNSKKKGKNRETIIDREEIIKDKIIMKKTNTMINIRKKGPSLEIIDRETTDKNIIIKTITMMKREIETIMITEETKITTKEIAINKPKNMLKKENTTGIIIK